MKNIQNLFIKFRGREAGQAIKNSSFQLAQNLVFKFGSLIFTIIIARILLPEKMGLYSLSLSTILLFAAFADLGISKAIMTFVSKNLGDKNNFKAKGYVFRLLKWKIILLSAVSVLMIPGALIISKYIYTGKPIFFILLAGSIYIPIASMVTFIEQVFKASNNFRIPLIKEVLFQTLRFSIIPFIILLTLRLNLSNQKIVFFTIVSAVFIYSIVLIFLLISARRKIKFLRGSYSSLNKKDSNDLLRFLIPLSVTAMSGMFFGYIDTLMLGYYISEKFIAFYSVAFNSAGAASTIISFMAISMMPIFARSSSKVSEKIFKKSKNIVILISTLTAFFVFILSGPIIRILYGQEYLASILVLKIYSLIILLKPSILIYSNYLTVKGKTKYVSLAIFISSVLNIILNFVGIVYGLNNYGEIGAIVGACIATVFSRFICLVLLVISKRKK